MSHIFILLIQIPYVILAIFCGISVVTSNWNEYFAARNKTTKTVFMVFENVETEAEQSTELVRVAA
ncbi:hypothetical protein [Emticicia sp. 21SJ11W-3]|uniref:hypothetical protein n=1 Tax=Emticicia sp. 21SJ11W-3 TaxID=2916755 RepID=UPI00209E3C58|nr:hypothetical protein [Emticicia sp. 21SJ11W-3]UTA69209.1 hypothetical protein MB380_05250 [Emticicia sp. 21SJ11W-3]